MDLRNVFLFGAGSTICWNSPTTAELTMIVRKSGFDTSDGVKITEYIFQKLISSGYDEIDANFETIINVIEELIVFYSCFKTDRKIPTILKVFLSDDDIKPLLNFSIKGGIVKHGYSLEIPKGYAYQYSNNAYNEQTPEQFFFQHLLSVILTDISSRISQYAYHIEGSSIVNSVVTPSRYFVAWMQRLSHNSVLRLYTLNYDRLFKCLLDVANISAFEGFYTEYSNEHYGIRANVLKVINDTTCNVCYNLHGCAFWDVQDVDDEGLPNAEVVLSEYLNLQINNVPASMQIEKGKTLMVTNIITGYQKAQKSIITPFKQMLHSFDRDCCNASCIYIIGYSFGDEHINMSIKSAIRYNPSVRFIIVDPQFANDEIQFQFALKFFPYYKLKQLNPRKVSDKIYSFYNGVFTAYAMTFLEFLAMQCDNGRM